MSDPTASLSLTDLNEECLSRIFNYVFGNHKQRRNIDLNDDFTLFEPLFTLSKVCTKFNAILHQTQFHKITEFKFDRYELTSQIDLIEAITCISPYIRKLYLSQCGFYDKNWSSVMKNVGSLIGTNLRELLIDCSEIPLDFETSMKRVLGSLEKLEIGNLHQYNIHNNNRSCTYVVSPPQYPNLKLILWKNVNLQRNFLPFKKQKRSSTSDLDVTDNFFLNFVQHYRQITVLRLNTPKANVQLATIVQYLPDLEELSFWKNWTDTDLSESMQYLHDLKNLSSLIILGVESDEFGIAINSLAELKQLRKLGLHSHQGFADINESLIRLAAKEFAHLKCIYLDICLSELDLIEIVRHGKKLEELHCPLAYGLTQDCIRTISILRRLNLQIFVGSLDSKIEPVITIPINYFVV